MSSEIETGAAPAAPVETPEVVVTPAETTPEATQPEGRRSREDARAAMMERLRPSRDAAEAAPETVETTEDVRTKPNRAGQDQPIDAQGRYASTEPSEAATQPTETPAESPAATQPGIVRIPIPEGHGLRAQGREFIAAAAEDETAVRALLNTEVRRAEVEQANRTASEWQQYALRMKAELEAAQEIRSRPEAQFALTEMDLVLLSDMEGKYPPEQIERVRNSMLAEKQIAVSRQIDTRTRELVAEAEGQLTLQQMQQTVQGFIAESQQAAKQYFGDILAPHQFDALYQRARRQYGADVEAAELAGESVSLDAREVLRIMRNLALDVPEVQQRLRQLTAKQQEEATRRQEEEAQRRADEASRQREAERLQQAAAKDKTKHPLGRISSAVRSDRIGTDTTDDLSRVPVHQRKQALRERAIARAG